MKKKTVRLLLCVTLVAVMAAISSVTVMWRERLKTPGRRHRRR